MWHLIKAVLLLLPRVIVSFFSWMIRYSNHPEKTPLEVRYKKVRHLICKANKCLGVDLIVEGKENIPNEASCYFANHLAAADPLMFFEALEAPTAFVGKIEVKKMPFVGRVFKSANGEFLDRKDLKQQLRVMMRVQDSLTKKECNWVIYPEGTRNKDQMANLLPFHHGTFRAAMRAGVPIVPVAEYGCIRLLSTKAKLKKYPTYLKFLKPLYPSDYQGKTTEEVAEMVRSMIQKEISFSIRKIDQNRMVELQKKNYRFNKLY